MSEIFGAFLIFGIILLVFAIVAYFLTSIAIYTMAKKRNIPNPWLAFIPVANLYIEGLIIGEFDMFSIKISKPEWVLPIAGLLPSFFVEAGAIGSLITILCIVVSFFGMYRLYFVLEASTATRNTILSIFLPVTAPFLLYSLRDK